MFKDASAAAEAVAEDDVDAEEDADAEEDTAIAGWTGSFSD